MQKFPPPCADPQSLAEGDGVFDWITNLYRILADCRAVGSGHGFLPVARAQDAIMVPSLISKGNLASSSELHADRHILGRGPLIAEIYGVIHDIGINALKCGLVLLPQSNCLPFVLLLVTPDVEEVEIHTLI